MKKYLFVPTVLNYLFLPGIVPTVLVAVLMLGGVGLAALGHAGLTLGGKKAAPAVAPAPAPAKDENPAPKPEPPKPVPPKKAWTPESVADWQKDWHTRWQKSLVEAVNPIAGRLVQESFGKEVEDMEGSRVEGAAKVKAMDGGRDDRNRLAMAMTLELPDGTEFHGYGLAEDPAFAKIKKGDTITFQGVLHTWKANQQRGNFWDVEIITLLGVEAPQPKPKEPPHWPEIPWQEK